MINSFILNGEENGTEREREREAGGFSTHTESYRLLQAATFKR